MSFIIPKCSQQFVDVAKDPRRKLIVTPEQASQGYAIPGWRPWGIVPIHQPFEFLARLDDGNYLVVDPRQEP